MLAYAETQTKQQLGNEKFRLEQELARLQSTLDGEVGAEPHEEEMVAVERAKNAALVDVLQRRLHDVEAALEAFERGSYGTCERCGEAISPERLAVKPDTTFCMPCQQEVETRRRGR